MNKLYKNIIKKKKKKKKKFNIKYNNTKIFYHIYRENLLKTKFCIQIKHLLYYKVTINKFVQLLKR